MALETLRGNGVAILGTDEYVEKDLVLFPSERIHDSFSYEGSPFNDIHPSHYDDFLDGYMIPSSDFKIFKSRRYRFIWKIVKVFDGPPIPLSCCVICDAGGQRCQLPYLGIVWIHETDQSHAGLSDKLMTKLIGWSNLNATDNSYFDYKTTLSPGKVGQLVFIPKMIWLRVMLDICDQKDIFYFPWEDITYDCKPYEVNFTTPVVARVDRTKALGRLLIKPCDMKKSPKDLYSLFLNYMAN
ncbi:hypothetical protein L0F63_000145 [Massospora cicadina]|nr:hypothetical protein L0F63_000145 [Massospora cicadina]